MEFNFEKLDTENDPLVYKIAFGMMDVRSTPPELLPEALEKYGNFIGSIAAQQSLDESELRCKEAEASELLKGLAPSQERT